MNFKNMSCSKIKCFKKKRQSLMVMTIDATSVQINYFYDYIQGGPMCYFSRKCVHSHICDYYSHICDYNVDVTN